MDTGEMTGSIKISNAGLFSLLVVTNTDVQGSDSIFWWKQKKCPSEFIFPMLLRQTRMVSTIFSKPVMIGRPTVYKLIYI